MKYKHINGDGFRNKLLVDDLNHDGRPDLVAGNLKLNPQCRASDTEPAELVYKDFYNNGKIVPVLCLYGQGKSYPHATRDELLDQIGMLRNRITNYETYASATLTDVFTPRQTTGCQPVDGQPVSHDLFYQYHHRQTEGNAPANGGSDGPGLYADDAGL